jgi:WD40 repeat protein/serine/threonine protein kinase
MSAINSGPTFARQRDIFLEALEQPTEEARAAFLARATAGDAQLRAVVETLLAQHHQDNFLELPATNFAVEGGGAAPLFPAEEVGQTIGRYKLIEVIGEGGCGTVFLAEQKEPVRRRVALKLIKLGMDTKSVVARFEAERQALALMDHPSIARVLDGGATPNGRPYFVMELVRGVRITEYCEANELRVRERITLFIQLCYAIQHAHQKGVIHRDIKPSNVLVTMLDGEPVPKVIDFGIAKAIEEPLTDKTLHTNFHAFIGTPVYTSPEQAQMTGSDVDTRSDIYSLGVLLYELLTGTPPFDPKELTRSGLDEMRRIIREVEPPRPSRSTSRPASGQPPIDPDLDWIIMKCIEKDRGRRYPTAQELAADLQRYLDHEPVRARPPSRAYLLQKTLDKHRRTVAAAAAILVALIAGATLSIWQAIRATTAEHAALKSQSHEASLRQRAEREREHALQNQRRAELNEYIADINLAHQAVLSGNLSRATDLLRKHLTAASTNDLRGFEWRYLWKLAQGDEQVVLAKEPASVFALAIKPPFFAVGLRDAVHIHDLQSGERLKSLPKTGTSLAFSPEGLLASGGQNAAHLWKASDWTELLSLPDIAGPVSFSRDGALLAARGWGRLRIFNDNDSREISSIPDAQGPVAFGPGGLLVANSRSGLKIFSTASGEFVRDLEDSGELFNGWVLDKPVVAFSPDGRFIVAGRMPVRSLPFGLDVWETQTGQRVASIPGERETPEHTGVISGIAFSPDGKTLATGSWDHSLRLWDLTERRCIRTIHGSRSEVWAVAFAPDGQHLISGAKDGTVALWPIQKQQNQAEIPAEGMPLHISEDGRLLALIAGNTLRFFNLKTHEVEREIHIASGRNRFSGPFFHAELSRDFSLLAMASGPNTVQLMNLKTQESTELHTPAGTGRIEWVTLSPTGHSLVTGRRGGGLLWWNLPSPSEVPKSMPGERAMFSGDGKCLVTLGGDEVQLTDANSGTILKNFNTTVPVRFSTALSYDGTVLAVASDVFDIENAIRLFDTRSGKFLGICSGHTQGVGWLAFSPDGKTFSSTSSDGTLRFWNVATQQQLLSLRNLASFSDLLFAPDGSCVIARSGNRQDAVLQILEAPKVNVSVTND